MSFPSWNWRGTTLWESFNSVLPLREMGTYEWYTFMQNYEPIEDEL